MRVTEIFAFVAFPYMCLAFFAVGHAYRYVTDRFAWNAHSSEFIEKKNLMWGSYLFHLGILGTLAGHAGGLLIPQRLFDLVGLNGEAHTALAYYSGMGVGLMTVIGALLLLWRRLTNRQVRRMTTPADWVVIVSLVVVSGLGTFNVFFGHFYVLDTIAPWIRSIVTLQPDPRLMVAVPWGYKIHILAALLLLAFSPFSRLVHIWSAPIFYLFRRPLVFRRHVTA